MRVVGAARLEKVARRHRAQRRVSINRGCAIVASGCRPVRDIAGVEAIALRCRYYHGDLPAMDPQNRTYRPVVSEAFDACRARLPWWQIHPLTGDLLPTRHIPFRPDNDTSAAAA